jgi:hypothetical protein
MFSHKREVPYVIRNKAQETKKKKKNEVFKPHGTKRHLTLNFEV